MVFFIVILFSVEVTQAQVTIGYDTPSEKSALLDLRNEADGSSNKGFLPPRVRLISLTSTEPLSSDTLPESIIVYNINETLGKKGLYYWSNKRWNNISSTDDALSNVWYNSATVDPATENSTSMYRSGNVGIGIDQSTNVLHVKVKKTVTIEGIDSLNYNSISALAINKGNVIRKISTKELVAGIIRITSAVVSNAYV